jgi:putative membrane protein
MKRIIRHCTIDSFSLWVVTQIAGGLVFEKGIYTLLLTGAAIAAVSFLAKPVINILLLPLNLVTFGLFRWVSSAVVLYIATLIVPRFKIINFTFIGFSTQWIDIPAMNLKGLFAFIAFSFILSIITSFIYWLIK